MSTTYRFGMIAIFLLSVCVTPFKVFAADTPPLVFHAEWFDELRTLDEKIRYLTNIYHRSKSGTVEFPGGAADMKKLLERIESIVDAITGRLEDSGRDILAREFEIEGKSIGNKRISDAMYKAKKNRMYGEELTIMFREMRHPQDTQRTYQEMVREYREFQSRVRPTLAQLRSLREETSAGLSRAMMVARLAETNAKTFEDSAEKIPAPKKGVLSTAGQFFKTNTSGLASKLRKGVGIGLRGLPLIGEFLTKNENALLASAHAMTEACIANRPDALDTARYIGTQFIYRGVGFLSLVPNLADSADARSIQKTLDFFLSAGCFDEYRVFVERNAGLFTDLKLTDELSMLSSAEIARSEMEYADLRAFLNTPRTAEEVRADALRHREQLERTIKGNKDLFSACCSLVTIPNACPREYAFIEGNPIEQGKKKAAMCRQLESDIKSTLILR